MTVNITDLSETELRKRSQVEVAYMLAGVMSLDGAKVHALDVMRGMARLGLQFVSVDDNISTDYGGTYEATWIRQEAIVVERSCSCDGGHWERLRDHDLKDWWHCDGDHHYTRKCRKGGSRVKVEDLSPPTQKSPGVYRGSLLSLRLSACLPRPGCP